MNTISQWWDDVKTAKTWYDKIKTFVFGKDVPMEIIVDALIVSMPWITPAKAGLKAALSYGDDVGKIVETIVKTEGIQSAVKIARAGELLKSSTLVNSLAIVSAITKTSTKLIPYSLAKVIGKMTGESAYKLATKGIDDLIKFILKPVFRHVKDIYFSLDKFVVAVTGNFLIIASWQKTIILWQTSFVGFNFTKIFGMLTIIQGQIYKIIIARLIKLEAEVELIKIDIHIQIKALEVKITAIINKNIISVTGLYTKLKAEIEAYKISNNLRVIKNALDININKTSIIKNAADIVKTNKNIKDMPDTIDKSLDISTKNEINDNITNNHDILDDEILDIFNPLVEEYWSKIMPVILDNLDVFPVAIAKMIKME